MTILAPPAFVNGRRMPNLWDGAAILCVLGVLVLVAHAAQGTLAPLPHPNATPIHLDPRYLPFYALRTTMRMFAALFFSGLFTLTVAPLAAKSRRIGLILIPALDILQSVPILGFLSFTVLFFMSLFPGRVLGAELAAIFAIFTSQAWNMAFSMYQSLRSVPADLVEIGQRAVAAIYAAVQRQAASKIELIEMNSRKLIDPATPGPRPTSQASQLEIQRLEQPIAGAQAETKHLRQERDPLADWSFCLDGDGRSTFCRLVRCQSCCIAASAIMLNCDFNRATVISTR